MLEIRIHGRGGQGAQVACSILADAFFRAGHWVQAFAAYGGERRGAPVTAYLRADERPVRVRCDVERPAYAIVLDPTLVSDVAALPLGDQAIVLVNAPAYPCGHMPGAARLIAVDATGIARRAGLGPIVSTAMLGAFGAVAGAIALEHLVAAVEHGSPVKKQENVEACRAGWQEIGVARETLPT
jgi:2-oxoacid:acceptor oxidoreductase gamma subunit (pyruvate/2-ketoisovalerate family)